MYRYLILVFLICLGGCDRQAPLVIARELANEAQMIDRKAEGADIKVIATLEKALPHFKRHLKSTPKDNEAHHETGDLLSRLGAALARQKRTEEAHERYTQALEHYREINSHSDQGRIYRYIAFLYRRTDDGKSNEWLDQSLEQYEQAGDQTGICRVLLDKVGIFRDLGDLEATVRVAERAYAMAETIQEPSLEALIYLKYAQVLYFGDIAGAGKIYERMLARDDFPASYHVAALQNYSGMAISEGNLDLAVTRLDRAQQLLESNPNPGYLAAIYLNRGAIHSKLGNHQQALRDFRLCEDLAKEHSLPSHHLASAMLFRGQLYDRMAEDELALGHYQDALDLFEKNGQTHHVINTLIYIGSHFLEQGLYEEARPRFARVLEIGSPDKVMLTRALSGLGQSVMEQGDLDEARKLLRQSLDVAREINYRDAQGTALSQLALIALKQDDPARAETLALDAEAVYKGIRDPLLQAASIHIQSRASIAAQQQKKALELNAKALSLMESMRAELRDEHLRRSFFRELRKLYDVRIQVLAEQGREADLIHAFETSEQARARNLLDILERSVGSREVSEKEEALRNRLIGRANRIRDANVEEDERAVLEKDLDRILTELRFLEAERRGSDKKQIAQISSLQEIRNNLLGDDAVLLEFTLMDEESFLWKVTQDELRLFRLPGRETIRDHAQRLLRLLTARNETQAFETQSEKQQRVAKADKTFAEEALAFSKIILGPVWPEIKGKRLLVIAEDGLSGLPFSALPTPESASPLILHNELILGPSASALVSLRKKKKREVWDKTLLVMADPVFDGLDPRLERESQAMEPERDAEEFVRLIYSGEEARAVSGQVPEMERDMYLGFEANLDRILEMDLGAYRILHFATHGVLDTRRPELCGLMFSRQTPDRAMTPGLLTQSHIYNLELGAELVVLSACQTGLGREFRGEGLVGLSQGFMYAGARGVVASLWKIQDKSTSALMARFYQHLLSEGQSPSSALRQAQLEIMKEADWSSPYYWAAFHYLGR